MKIIDKNIKPGNHAGERMTLTINDVEYAFRWCPAGTFQMGSPESEKGRGFDETQHQVILSEGFWLQETEVTQEQWESVMGYNLSNFKGSQLPVENVSWYDCQDYIDKLNLFYSFSDYRFSLPTEAQWEYACRAGSTTAYNFGSTLNGDNANCNGNYSYGTEAKGTYLEKTATVGSYPANTWGLYDMHGNVYEWCKDWYDLDHVFVDDLTESVTDPTGSDGCDVTCVMRGGAWNDYATACRSACRGEYAPKCRENNMGLRCALVKESE
jgi:formylglycine-generating enzyme required for sulfatase activity